MDKFQALENIKKIWEDSEVKLGDKIISISTNFYSAGLDLATTAAYIKATPIELDSFLALGGLDDELLEKISKANPPKTTWAMLANANEDEVEQALDALMDGGTSISATHPHYTYSEFIYQKMIEISGPTTEQKVAALSGDDLKHVLKKGEDFGVLNDYQTKFLKSIAAQKKRGKVLTDKQVSVLMSTLEVLVNKKVVIHNSIDGDQDICDRILDAVGK